MANDWTRVEPGLVVGSFVPEQIGKLRQEIGALRGLVDRRVRSAPGLLPFGSEVAIAMTAAPPSDGRLRALLARGIGADEPESIWQWHELDYWIWLSHACTATLALLPEAGTEVELRSDSDVQAVSIVVEAIRVVSGYRAETETDAELCTYLTRYSGWCAALLQALNSAATAPPLPQHG